MAKKYKTKFYPLDAIILVGYHVNFSKAIQFKIWATNVLKEHFIKGYSIYKPRLAHQGLHELHQTVDLLQKPLKNQK